MPDGPAVGVADSVTVPRMKFAAVQPEAGQSGGVVSTRIVAVLTASMLPALSAEKYATVRAPSTAGTATEVPGVQAPPSSEYCVVLMPDATPFTDGSLGDRCTVTPLDW